MAREAFFSVRPFLPHAVAATLAVIVGPVVLVLALMAVADLSVFMVAALAVVIAIASAVIGSAWWAKRIESVDISFSDLMLWRWYVRRRAEDTLEEGARLLGLDRAGHPIDDVRITPEQQLQVLKDLTAALESKDPYTHGHSQRVERHVYRTAAAMHLTIHDIEDLRKAAALHDVGKIRVPDRILRKPDGLTIEERAVMEEHSVVGAWMVSSVGNADVIAAVRHHHERWDGYGYPDGLASYDIPLFSRIIAVADAYDAMTSTRPYRPGAGRENAIESLRKEAGVQFDPQVVESFVNALPARLPVTAALFVVVGGGLQRALREVAAWLKRFGAGTLTPAVGAAGAAVVLGAAAFTPNLPPTEGSIERSIASAPQSSARGSEGDRQRVRGKRFNKKSGKTGRQAARKGTRRTAFRRAQVAASDPNEVLADDSVRDGGSTGQTGGERESGPWTPPSSGGRGNPNDGRDGCPDDGNAGQGNDNVCGDPGASGGGNDNAGGGNNDNSGAPKGKNEARPPEEEDEPESDDDDDRGNRGGGGESDSGSGSSD
jgi:HD-GYP domain-containing protein (c-di-GMP phosphodiesterase class II)